ERSRSEARLRARFQTRHLLDDVLGVMFGTGQNEHHGLRSRILGMDLFFRVRDVAVIAPCFGLPRPERLAQPGTTADRVAAEFASRALLVAIDMSIYMQDVDFDNAPAFMPAPVEDRLASRGSELLRRCTSLGFEKIAHSVSSSA